MMHQGVGISSYSPGTGAESTRNGNGGAPSTSSFSPNSNPTRLPTYVPPPLPPPTGSSSERVSSLQPAYLSKRMAPPPSNPFFGGMGEGNVDLPASFSSLSVGNNKNYNTVSATATVIKSSTPAADSHANGTFAAHSAATLHTLTQLQQFFDAHQFDTAGPYADLFNVLLSSSKHVVDVGLVHHVTLTEYSKAQQRMELEVEALCDYSARCRDELQQLVAAEDGRESRALQAASAAGQLDSKMHTQLTKEVDILRSVVEGMHRRLLQFEQETLAMRTEHRLAGSESKKEKKKKKSNRSESEASDESSAESSEDSEDEKEHNLKKKKKKESKDLASRMDATPSNQELSGAMDVILARLDRMQERMDKLQRGVEAHALFTEDELESVKRSHLELRNEYKTSAESGSAEKESSAQLRTFIERTTEQRCAIVEENMKTLMSGLLHALQPGSRSADTSRSMSNESRNSDASDSPSSDHILDSHSGYDDDSSEEEEERQRPSSHRNGGSRVAAKRAANHVKYSEKGGTKFSKQSNLRKHSQGGKTKKHTGEGHRGSRNKHTYADDFPEISTSRSKTSDSDSDRNNDSGSSENGMHPKRTEKVVVSKLKMSSKHMSTSHSAKRHSIDMKYFAIQFRKLRDMERMRMESIEARFDDFERRLEVMEVYAPHSCAMAAKPPVLGVELRDSHEEQGVRVERTFPGYAAERAGIKQGDVVVAVNGFMVTTRAEMFAVLSELAREKQYLSAFQRMNGLPAMSSGGEGGVGSEAGGGGIVATQVDGALDNAVLAVTSLDPRRFDIALHVKRGSKMSTITVVAFSGNEKN